MKDLFLEDGKKYKRKQGPIDERPYVQPRLKESSR
jgi:hypothetical protein